MYSSGFKNSSTYNDSREVSCSDVERLYKFKAHHTFLSMCQHDSNTTMPSVFIERFVSSSNYINADENSAYILLEAGMSFCELFSRCLALQQEIFATSHYFARNNSSLPVTDHKTQKLEQKKKYEQYVNVLSMLNRLSFKTRPLHATAALAACFALPPIVALHNANERMNSTSGKSDESEIAAVDLCAQFDSFVPLCQLWQPSSSTTEYSQNDSRLMWHEQSNMSFSIYKAYIATLTTLLFDTTVSTQRHNTFLPVHPRFTLEEYMHRISHQQYTTAYGYSVRTWSEEIIWRLLISLVSVLALVHSVNLHFNGQISAADVVCFVALPTLPAELTDIAISIRDAFGSDAADSDKANRSNKESLSHGNNTTNSITTYDQSTNTINSNNSFNKFQNIEGVAVEEQVWSMYMKTASSSVILPHVFITAETAPQHTFFVLNSLMSAFTQSPPVNTEEGKERLLRYQRNDLIAVGRLLSRVIDTICNASDQHEHNTHTKAQFSSELLFIIKRLESEEEQNNMPTALQLSHLHAFTLRTQLWLNALLAEENHLQLREMWEQHKLSTIALTSHDEEHQKINLKESDAKEEKEQAAKSHEILELAKQLKEEECQVKMATREQELTQKEEMLAVREEELAHYEKKLNALLSLYDLTYKHLEELKLPTESNDKHMNELQNRFMNELRKGNYNSINNTDNYVSTENQNGNNDDESNEKHNDIAGGKDELVEMEVQTECVKNNSDGYSNEAQYNKCSNVGNTDNVNSMTIDYNNVIDFTTPIKSRTKTMTEYKEQMTKNYIYCGVENQDSNSNDTKNISLNANSNNAELYTPVQHEHEKQHHHRLRRSPKLRMTEPNWMENQMQELDEIESCLTSDEKRTPQSLMQSPDYVNDRISNTSNDKANLSCDNNSRSKVLHRNVHRSSHTAQSAVKSLFGAPVTNYESYNTINERRENAIVEQSNNISQQEQHQQLEEQTKWRYHNINTFREENVNESNTRNQKCLKVEEPHKLHYLHRTPDKQKYRTSANLFNAHNNKVSNEVTRMNNNYAANKGNNINEYSINNGPFANQSGRNSISHVPNTFTVRTSYVTPRSARSVRANSFADSNFMPKFAASATNFRRSMTTNTFKTQNDKWRQLTHIDNSHNTTMRKGNKSHLTSSQNNTSVISSNKRKSNFTNNNNNSFKDNINHYVNIGKYVKSGADVLGTQKELSDNSHTNNMLWSDQHQSSVSSSLMAKNITPSPSPSSSPSESTTRFSTIAAARVAKEMLEQLRGSVTMKT